MEKKLGLLAFLSNRKLYNSQYVCIDFWSQVPNVDQESNQSGLQMMFGCRGIHPGQLEPVLIHN